MLKNISTDDLLWAGFLGMFFSVPTATSPTVIFGVAVMAIWFLSGRFLRDVREWLRSDFAWPVALLVFLPWVGLLYTPETAEGLSVAVKTHYWIFAIALPPVISSRKDPDRLVRIFLAGLSVNSIISLLQYAGLAPLKKGLPTGLLGGSSAHIAYSLLLCTGILIASFYFCRSRGKDRLFFAALMVQFFIVLGFTGGRSGYAALIVLFPLVVYNITGQRHIVKIILLCAVGICLLFSFPVVRSRIAKAGEDLRLYRQGSTNTSLGLRFRMWEVSWAEIKQRPLTGLGTAGFKRSWELNKGDSALPFHFHPHNSFLFMMVSYGILGLAAFCRLLWIMLRRGWHARDSALGFALFAFTVVFIIGSLTDTEVLVFAPATALPLFAGIANAVKRD